MSLGEGGMNFGSIPNAASRSEGIGTGPSFSVRPWQECRISKHQALSSEHPAAYATPLHLMRLPAGLP